MPHDRGSRIRCWGNARRRDARVRNLGRLAGGAAPYFYIGLRGSHRSRPGLPGGLPGFPARVRSGRGTRARARAGQPESYSENDLYPDVRSALSKLRAMGVWVGVVGNQTVRSGQILRSLDLPTDFIATSDDWGVEKPSPAFFSKVVEVAPCSAAEIVYVGDRIDNDVAPAKAAGMRTAYIQRGPWGWILRDMPEVAELSDWRIRDLSELPGIVATENEC
ncbi:HAD family hydrolase [Nocardia sp. NPDC049190]|uniref:HAD family hydrolase n=1 Tax=Nocardia sp. NPDC049190 TaxID=3155650 RepID=UPI0033F05116